jgi:hypothetical protein
MNPVTDLEALRRRLEENALTPARRAALQRELADSTTPAQRAELDEILRRLPASETAAIRDLVYR